MKVGVIGAGAWGTALATISAKGGNDVYLWSFDGEYKHFDGIESLPENLFVTRNMADLENMDVWLMVTPAAFFRETIKKAGEFYRDQPLIVCTKGAEASTGQFMSEIIATELPDCKNLGVLSGPQFAAEVAKGVPTGSTLAGNDAAWQAGKQALNLLYLTQSDDIVGTELCGVGKNAVALICGYNSIASQGENDRALAFTRAWNEVVDLGLVLGAKERTFLGLCGIGDLFLSATSATSRNFAGGMAIARGEKPEGTVEGIFALRGLIKRAEEKGVKTPVLTEMKSKLNI